MASYEQVIKFENEKPQGVIRLVEANGGRAERFFKGAMK